MRKNAIRSALFGLGFLSISTQIYLLRESYIVFYGNELILGIMLSVWMLLTGAGAWLGRYFSGVRRKFRFILFLMLLLSALPVLMMIKLDLYRALVLPAGTIAGLNDVIYAAFLVQLPFCLINGFLFSSLSALLRHAGNAYSLEASGSMVAGAVVNFILLWLLPAWLSLLLMSGLYLATVVFFSFSFQNRMVPLLTVFVSGLILFALFTADARRIGYHSMYPGQSVIENRETPYGQLVITANASQLNFYENGLLMFSSGDNINNEENVHYAMVQHSAPKNVLIVSGGLSGAIAEILKYHPLRVDYVELNPALLRFSEGSLKEFEKKAVFLHAGDARRFVKNSSAVYDVVLILLPPPSSLQLNRLYTSEFLTELKSRLSPDGIVSYSLPTTSDYISHAGGGLNSILYRTLKESFKNVLLVPGGKTYFIASDSELSLDIPILIERKGIPTSYVNKYYLNTSQMKERSAYMNASISPVAGINNDFRPLMFFAQMNYWMSYFNRHYITAMILLLLVFLVALFNLTPVNTGLFTGGFTAGALQILILLSLQVYCGYVFQLTGFIIMLFMLGLSMGSLAGARWSGKDPFRSYLAIQLSLAALSVLIPLALIMASRMALPLWVFPAKVSAVTVVLAFMVGMEYSFAFRLSQRNKALAVSKNYSADLFGSALGAFIVPVILFPLLGLMNTGYVLALLNTAGAAALYIKRRNFVSL
ncbi:MAG: hypothetical protein WCI48_12090 [Bacteroidota bacterium]|jgi:spermidine synthase